MGKKLKSFKQYSSGEMGIGSDELANKYKRDTPGQEEGHAVTSFSADKPELSPTARESGIYTANEAGPCWDGYKQLGMKKGKSGKPVPNCVKESQPNKFDSSTVLIFRRNPNTGEMKEMRIDKIKVNEYLSRGWVRK